MLFRKTRVMKKSNFKFFLNHQNLVNYFLILYNANIVLQLIFVEYFKSLALLFSLSQFSVIFGSFLLYPRKVLRKSKNIF